MSWEKYGDVQENTTSVPEASPKSIGLIFNRPGLPVGEIRISHGVCLSLRGFFASGAKLELKKRGGRDADFLRFMVVF